MSARTFGTNDGLDTFADKYGSDDYATVGRMIGEAQSRPRIPNPALSVARNPDLNTATPKAIDYLVNLSRKAFPDVQPINVRNWAASVDRTEVSAKIDWLKAQPSVFISDAAPADSDRLERHEVPAGRYAVDGNEGQTVFIRVDIPTDGRWVGRIFVKVQAGDDLHRTSRDMADALLAKIAAAGVQDAMLRYGREIGSCGHCGRTLTNEESRAYGIGPVCRGKMGW